MSKKRPYDRSLGLDRARTGVIARNPTSYTDPNSQSFFPPSIRAKLIYNSITTAETLSSGSSLWNYYRLNNATDPYQPTGGHQPMGFDQLSEVYNKAVIVAAKVRFQIWPTDEATEQQIMRIVARPYSSNTTQPNVVNDEFERTGATCIVQPNSNMKTSPNVIYVQNWKILGYSSPEEYEADDSNHFIMTNIYSNMLREVHLAIGCDQIGVQQDIKTAWTVNITYYIKCFERKIVSPS